MHTGKRGMSKAAKTGGEKANTNTAKLEALEHPCGDRTWRGSRTCTLETTWPWGPSWTTYASMWAEPVASRKENGRVPGTTWWGWSSSFHTSSSNPACLFSRALRGHQLWEWTGVCRPIRFELSERYRDNLRESPEQKTWLPLLRQRQFREEGKGTLGFMEGDIIQGRNHLFINCAAQHPTQNPTASMVPHALYSRRSLSTMHIRSNRKVTSHLKTYKTLQAIF